MRANSSESQEERVKGKWLFLFLGAIFICFGIAAAAQYNNNHIEGYLIVAILFGFALVLDVFVVVALWRKGH
jgi:uncharacterized membrane protein HdeD (DUF308 family)